MLQHHTIHPSLSYDGLIGDLNNNNGNTLITPSVQFSYNTTDEHTRVNSTFEQMLSTGLLINSRNKLTIPESSNKHHDRKKSLGSNRNRNNNSTLFNDSFSPVNALFKSTSLNDNNNNNNNNTTSTSSCATEAAQNSPDKHNINQHIRPSTLSYNDVSMSIDITDFNQPNSAIAMNLTDVFAKAK